ncbi:MAG: bL28 family ribosomal protein [Candidatus Hodgkinia cicadicola]
MIKVKAKPQFGNIISYSNKKNKRKFLANLKKFKLWSPILRNFIYLKSSVKFIRTVIKYGNIDFYIINCKFLPKHFYILKKNYLNWLGA